MYIRLRLKTSFLLVRYFFDRFLKSPEIIDLIKIILWEANYSMLMDGQTGITKLVVYLRNFANAPKNR